MADTSTTNFRKVLEGIVVLAILAFLAFGAAGLGWYAGAALARVIGL